MAQPKLETVSPHNELEPREGVDRARVGRTEPAHVADDRGRRWRRHPHEDWMGDRNSSVR
jgi:hypothetical protein